MYFLPFTFLVPLLSFIILYVFNKQLSRQQTIGLGVGSVFISALSACIAILSHLLNYTSGTVVGVILWKWTSDISLSNSFGLAFDGLSIMLTGLICFVGLLVHIYAVWYLQSGKALAKVLSYSNLLLASMLMVVLSDNLLFLYFGWEGLGIACYLMLTSLAKDDPYASYVNLQAISGTQSTSTALVVATESSKSQAQIRQQQCLQNNEQIYHTANKFVILNRIGYLCLALAFILIAKQFSTLSIVEITSQAPELFAQNTPVLVVITSLLAVASIAKCAQLPLHTWLIGLGSSNSATVSTSAKFSTPSLNSLIIPFLTLVQAVTLVIAGVYLIARLHPLFVLTPDILTWWIGYIGAMTIVVGALSASVQTDINRVLAYSSMSQVGFMFVALGVGAWQVAIFHLLVHGVAKSLLVLTSGAVMQSFSQETNILKMGSLRHSQPLLFLAFIIGGGALIGLPFITIGYFSLDGILLEVYLSEYRLLFNLAIMGVFLTAFYICRLGWYVFLGKAKSKPCKLSENANLGLTLPLALLMLLSTAVGLLFSPDMTNVLKHVLPTSATLSADDKTLSLVNFNMVIAITAGMVVAWLLYVMNKARISNGFARSSIGGAIVQLCYQGFGFDALYHAVYQRIHGWLFVKKTVETGLDMVEIESERDESVQTNMLKPRYVVILSLAMAVIVTLMTSIVL